MGIMVASGIGLFPLVMWLGMLGLPLGVPPLPEDPQMAKIAPEECLFYLSFAGVGVPDAKSENQVEQMLAEPEVKRMAAEIERAIKDVLTKKLSGPRGMPIMNPEDAAMLGKLFITSPKAIYLADLKVQPGGPPQIRGGMIVSLGTAAEKVKTILENTLPKGPIQRSESEGATWYRFQPAPDAPIFKLGVKDQYFVLGLGEGEVEAMLKRAEGNSPAWLEKIAQDLPIERRSMVQYINVKKLLENFLPMTGPQGSMITEALGLSNVTAICATTGLDKTEFVSRSLIAIDGEPQGIFSPANGKSLTNSDAAGLPADATFAATVRLNPQQLFEMFLSLAEKFEPREKAHIVEAMEQLQAALGVKIPDDLLGPLGDTVSLYDSPSEGGLVLGLTAVVKVKDPTKAKATYAKLMNVVEAQQRSAEKAISEHQSGLNYSLTPPKVEKLEYAGKTIYFFNARQRDFLLAPAWCLTDDELIIAMFPQSIKARLDRGEKFQSLAEKPELKQALASEAGTLAVGYCDTTRLFDHLYPMFLIMAQSATNELQREGIDLNMSVLPSTKAIRDHLRPGIFTIRRTKAGIEISERTTLPGVGLAVTTPMAAFVVLPMRMSAQHSAMGAAQHAHSVNNMKQIGLAMHNYHDARRIFPPAFKADKDGKPLLSWRVLVLPNIDEDELYNQFHLNEPWDSEHNKKLIDKMPNIYKAPTSKAGAGKTNYLTVRGEKTIYSGSKGFRIADIADGTSNTIMVVEASDEKAVPWTKPDDFEYDEKDPIKGLVGLQPNEFLALFADGAVRTLPKSIDPKVLKALFTRDGGEAVDPNQIR
jgi:hypothetical protein